MMPASAPVLGVVHTPPAFEVPHNACDCHTHIFGPADRFPYSSKRLYTPGDASIGDLLALHCALHIDRVVIVHPSPYGTDNACTVDAVRRLGARARGVITPATATRIFLVRPTASPTQASASTRPAMRRSTTCWRCTARCISTGW